MSEGSSGVVLHPDPAQGPAQAPFQIRACDECKRQKMKCSSAVDYPGPCKRCRDREQACTFTDKPRRTLKRQRKTAQAATSGDDVQRPVSWPQNPPHETTRRDSMCACQPPLMPGIRLELERTFSSRESPDKSDFNTATGLTSVLREDSGAESAAMRSIHGIEVSQTEINDIFMLFFEHFGHHLVSFLDPSLSPDQYFADSPLLFWTIVAIGSQQYSLNPTLLGALATPILDLLWSSMMRTHEKASSVIESIVLLATWSFPFRTIFKDVTFNLSGMSISLGMQIGLHIPKHAQEFSLTPVGSSSVDCCKRVNLWANCVLCRLRAVAVFGHPPVISRMNMMTISQSDLLLYVPDEVAFQLRAVDLASQASYSVFESEFEADDDHVTATLAMLEGEFNALESELGHFQDQERLQFHIARLQMRIYYFNSPIGSGQLANLTKLYEDSVTIISLYGRLDETLRFSSSCPTYVWLMLGLAACAILKLLKSTSSALRDSMDLSEGRRSFFAAIALLKKTSIQADDGPGHLAGALTQLWTSRKATEYIGYLGSDPLLHIKRPRIRLSMSLFYETLRWYRDEYGGQAFLVFLAPREAGIAHSALSSKPVTSSQPPDIHLDDENFEFELGDVDLEDPVFANWTPMSDNDFRDFGMFPSWE